MRGFCFFEPKEQKTFQLLSFLSSFALGCLLGCFALSSFLLCYFLCCFFLGCHNIHLLLHHSLILMIHMFMKQRREIWNYIFVSHNKHLFFVRDTENIFCTSLLYTFFTKSKEKINNCQEHERTKIQISKCKLKNQILQCVCLEYYSKRQETK